MSRHLEEVATSTLNQKQSRHQLEEKLRSRHHSMVATLVALKRRSRQHLAVATSIAKTLGRDIIKQSRQQKKGTEVATSVRGRDIRCKDQKVTTTFNCRDIKYKEMRSRRHKEVATSISKKRSRDKIELS